MFRIFSFLLSLVLTAGYASAQGSLRQIDLEGRPANVNFEVGGPSMDQPLVIALHGSSGNSIQFQVQSSVLRHVRRAGLRVALVNGQPWSRPEQPGNRTYYGQMRSWNSGWCCWNVPEDDVAYLARTITQLQEGATGDGRKVVLVGHSNGAMMAYDLMCQRPDLVHAVLGIAGLPSFTDCQASNTRLIHVHGDADSTVTLAGDLDLSDGRQFISLAQQRALFARAGILYSEFIVAGAEHGLGSIERGLREQTGFSLGALAVALTAY